MGRWEINGISGQDALSKITLNKYVNGQIDFLRVKHEECQELTYIWSQIESDIELKKIHVYIYQQQIEINYYKFESTLRPFRSLVFSLPRRKAQVSFSDQICPLSVVVIVVVVVVNFSHFHLLLQNQWAHFNQSWHKSSLGEGESSLFKWRAPSFSKGR